MFIYQQSIIQNLQMFPILQTSFSVGTFFAVNYSKPALRAYCPDIYIVPLAQNTDYRKNRLQD